MAGPTGAMKPWTIKSMNSEARLMAIIAARQENMTVGQWLERVIREAAEQQRTAPRSFHQLARLIEVAEAMARAADARSPRRS